MIHETPSLWVVAALILFYITFRFYSKTVDTKAWQADPSRPTPAHVYADGVEFFPVGRYVLYGFQFNSIAALGPILGPGIALIFGWIPALLWILFANIFIGWAQDYSALFLSVRSEGKSLGPISYEWLGARARQILLVFLMMYLLLINAAFLFVVAVVLDVWPGTFWALVVLVLAAFVTGQLIFKVRMNILAVTLIAVILIALGVFIGAAFPWPPTGALGKAPYTLWLLPLVIILALGSLLPLPRLITPMNYIAYYPNIIALALIIFSALISPVTGVRLEQPAFTSFFAAGRPLWPILFVAIACGAISGWHSLISTGLTARQLDVETDARPVGAGAMLTEGTVALGALAAFMVLAPEELVGVAAPARFVAGATKLALPLFGEGARAFLSTFFGLFMVFMAVTILTILGRYWRVVTSELVSGTKIAWFGNKYVATVHGFVFPIAFVLTGSWINIWLYFGGTNQLLAGFALTLVGIYLLSKGRFGWYALVPGLFMLVTTLAALIWQAFFVFLPSTVDMTGIFPFVRKPGPFPQQAPLVQLGGEGAALALNAFSVVFGAVALIFGAAMFGYLLRAWSRVRKQQAAQA